MSSGPDDPTALCFTWNNPDLTRDLMLQDGASTGKEDTSFKLMSRDQHEQVVGGQDTIDVSTILDTTYDVLCAKGEKSFAEYMKVISTGEKDSHFDGQNNREQASLVDVIAADANINISLMKSDVDTALLDTQSSQGQLMNYRDFIEKKRKQRLQCLRDLKEHCCTCQGPHISKPPFSHGKDYRREPTHSQNQDDECLFLKKTRSELKWLDETLGNYCKNNERFELEIERRKAEAQSRKENMKEALANSLRLMEIADSR
ncbi:hypothetical protein ACHAW5_003796 [Stephanodiscus triporus]|uniref:Uncharacterized protein n=1 Tax=Stephanodiscus triporus TaxID=2934178 RepID=A0ABD3P5Z6_9STRA